MANENFGSTAGESSPQNKWAQSESWVALHLKI